MVGSPAPADVWFIDFEPWIVYDGELRDWHYWWMHHRPKGVEVHNEGWAAKGDEQLLGHFADDWERSRDFA